MSETNGISSPSMESIEEGIPTKASTRLSKISKMYDVDGDGKLDAAEQAMRDMDKEGKGHLSNQQVYTIFQEQLKMQKQLLMAKRIIIFFAVLLVILAVANVGVAFAAAALAKDTTTQNNVLVAKGTGEVVATDTNTHIFNAGVTEERRLELEDEHRRLGAFVATSACNPFCIIEQGEAAVEINRLCKAGQPVIVQLEYNIGGTQEILTSYHVCNQAVTETITEDSTRDGSLLAYNVSSTTLGTYEFADAGAADGSWTFNVPA